MSTCPNGHQSASSDYCDTCGAPISGEAPASAASSTPDAGAGPTTVLAEPQECPNCGVHNIATALFCEACGYDFTTGSMPRPPDAPAVENAAAESPAVPSPSAESPAVPSPGAAAPEQLATTIALEWVAELWVDPDWYAAQDSDDPCPSPGLPVVVALTKQSVLVGRPSVSRNIHPDVDCTSDSGVSRRQAQLTTDGQRWWVEDLQSSNGTYVGPASGPLPTAPLPPGQRRELGEDDRVYLGTWTRLVVRRATPEEQAGQVS